MSTSNNNYDVVIIGAGPAGLNAALYLSRANLRVVFIEKGAPGGKMTTTFNISNWIGVKEIHGARLAMSMLQHVKENGAIHKYGNVVKFVNVKENKKEVHLENGEIFYSKIVIIATGMVNRIPEEIEGIHEFENKGVSYCVVCDGSLYGKNNQSIIGGGNSAFEESLYLSNIAKKVNIFVKDNEIIAEPKIVEQVQNTKNIEIFLNAQVKKIIGTSENGIEKLEVNIDGQDKIFDSKSLFPYIGFLPATSFIKNLDIFNDKGFIMVDKNMETNVKGIFAVGDIIEKDVRQIVTAASDGAIAAKYISGTIPKD